MINSNDLLRLLYKRLECERSEEKALVYQRFFKTGKGEYGEGDIFLGLSVPKQREIAKEYKDLDFESLGVLMDSKIHEHRLCALLILVENFERCYRLKDDFGKERICQFYLKNVKGINNWDLVDLSAPKILGCYFYELDRRILFEFARDSNLWLRRIAVVSSFYFIKKGDYGFTLEVCEMLLGDKQDLIHKACGWMLREIGKRDVFVLKGFLDRHFRVMPRTMLRYSIERLSDIEKGFYMKR